ncbi:uncharacterized protein BDCG_17955, partial [Blastomyces dermatitidis ER-3]
SSHIDRSVSADDSELNITFLIENLKNMIMKKLFMLYMTEYSVSLLASSATSFSATSLSVSFSATSQSSTLTSMSGSLTSATSVPVTLTSATSDFIISAFITSSLCFKKILYRLNKLSLSTCTLSLFLSTLRIIYYTKT